MSGIVIVPGTFSAPATPVQTMRTPVYPAARTGWMPRKRMQYESVPHAVEDDYDDSPFDFGVLDFAWSHPVNITAGTDATYFMSGRELRINVVCDIPGVTLEMRDGFFVVTSGESPFETRFVFTTQARLWGFHPSLIPYDGYDLEGHVFPTIGRGKYGEVSGGGKTFDLELLNGTNRLRVMNGTEILAEWFLRWNDFPITIRHTNTPAPANRFYTTRTLKITMNDGNYVLQVPGGLTIT